MSEWKEYRIKDLGIVVTGKTPSSQFPEEFGFDMPFITPSDYKYYGKWADSSDRGLSKDGIKKLQNKVLPPSSVLVTCIGSDMGKVVLNKVPAITNQQINSIIPNQELVTTDFLYYKMIDCYETIRMYSQAGSAVPIVNKGDFEEIILEVPEDIEEQKSIASVLGSLDDKIDLLHRQNKTLEALAETLFRQWLNEAAPQPSPALSHGERNTEKGEEGWETGKLGDYADVSTGKGLRRHEFDDNGIYPVLGANGEIGRTNNYLTADRLILTGRVGTLGKVYISKDKVWISDNVLIIRPESIFFYPIYFILKRTEFENLNVGSTQPLVTQTDLKNIEFKLPSVDILKSYEAQCATYFEKISKNQIQIRTLTRLRDTLLPKLMSGEVRVKEREIGQNRTNKTYGRQKR